MGRQIKKTIIKYEQSEQKPNLQSNSQLGEVKGKSQREERQRSREKVQNVEKPFEEKTKEVTVDVNSRKARLQAMKKARQIKQKQQTQNLGTLSAPTATNETKNIKIVIVDQENPLKKQNQETKQIYSANGIQRPQKAEKDQNNLKIQEKSQNLQQIVQNQAQSSEDSEEQEDKGPRVMHRPVFLSKEDRSQLHESQQQQKLKQEERRKKNLRYTTKILLEETLRKQEQQDSEQEIDNNDDQDETNLPDDNDSVNQELQYELWKIRELKRIRRDRELRQKHLVQKMQIQRRREMNNEEILLENRLLGSDSTDHDTETKYVFMQKYYHKGAFYQDSNDPIFQRDYNLPTPMEMQDKSALPSVLQKRKGNFGKRGQSKYTHLTAEDTTDTNPLTRADESLLNSWKKKMAGYKK